ncbi:PucR family transcriptional regulator ligand-binding domain-containing protein [Siminovitchia sp. FSL H7-0308]|uniref:PucR family transcriptional regulator ligand-binding domain-containing protein n=1 Tax=unclassified Siminovitchia TaxID=2837530 RepID=UPI0030D21139
MIKHGVSVKEIVHFTSIFQKVLVPPKRDRMIQKVSVIEVKEFGSWVKGNELALTTIQNFHTKELQLSLFQQLIKGKAACLVFHPGNIHEKQAIFHETLEVATLSFSCFPSISYSHLCRNNRIDFQLKMKKQHQEIDTLNEVNQLYFQFLSHHINLKEVPPIFSAGT